MVGKDTFAEAYKQLEEASTSYIEVLEAAGKWEEATAVYREQEKATAVKELVKNLQQKIAEKELVITALRGQIEELKRVNRELESDLCAEKAHVDLTQIVVAESRKVLDRQKKLESDLRAGKAHHQSCVDYIQKLKYAWFHGA
jgi:2,4-dienoyl-CoA reductase-like NADH-dependent reductase (Old Yellow Enzyme family)